MRIDLTVVTLIGTLASLLINASLIVVAWINSNKRIDDFNKRFDDNNSNTSSRFNSLEKTITLSIDKAVSDLKLYMDFRFSELDKRVTKLELPVVK